MPNTTEGTPVRGVPSRHLPQLHAAPIQQASFRKFTTMTQPHPRDRRFGIRGIPTRILLMLAVAFALVETLVLVTGLAGPLNEGRERLSKLAHTISIGDAWAFLGVVAAFVVAIQLTAWGNQQAGDRLAHSRSSRFTIAAVLTGSITAASWVLFTIAFNTEATGKYLLLTAAAAGIIFFAADGASIVLRQDRRGSLRAESRQAIRATCVVLRREFLGMKSPAAVLIVCIVAFTVWCLLFSAGAFALLTAAPVWGGKPVTLTIFAATYSVIASLLIFLVASSVGSAASWLVWVSGRRRTGRPPLAEIGWLLAAVLFAIVVVVSCVYLFVAFMLDGAPWWAAAIMFLIFTLPAAIPFTALTTAGRASPRTHWWTPRGSVRIGFAAVMRAYIVSHLQDVRELSIVFDEVADRGGE